MSAPPSRRARLFGLLLRTLPDGMRARLCHSRTAAVLRRIAYAPVSRSTVSALCFRARRALDGSVDAFGRRVLLPLLLAEAKRRARRRLAAGRPGTVWGVTPILTLPLLARCDRMLGLRSTSWVFTTYYITRGFGLNMRAADLFFARASRIWWRAHRMFRYAVLARAMLRFDAVNLFYDRGFMPGSGRFGIEPREIELLHAAGLRINLFAYGADVRRRAVALSAGPVNICAECPNPGRFCICSEDEFAASFAPLDHRITARVAMGDMLAPIPGSHDLHYWPIDMARMRAIPVDWHPGCGRPLRIAHAPNHPHFKGTVHLERAIERLRAEGHAVEMLRVQGVPNEKVLEIFAAADLVADQFIAGFHGYAAYEAMALGRPVLAYLRGPEMAAAPEECPIINTPPRLVEEVLRRLLDGELDLADLGARSRRYAERHCAIEAVAARLGRLYLATAGYPPGVNAMLEQRVAALDALLPAPMVAPPPISWAEAAAAAQALAAEPARPSAA